MRILAGQHKGRRLLAPKGSAVTRPITGLVKKSLFDMLGQALEESLVVDLYCGTGTLGLESLSRGARLCCFAERDHDALLRLRRNIQTMEVQDRCIIWPGDLTRGLERRLDELDGPVDVAFVDPPYAVSRQWSWDEAVGRIFVPLGEHLAADGTVVLRVDRSVAVPQRLGPLGVRRRREYGSTVVVLLGHEPNG